MFTYTNIMSARRCYRTKSLYLIIYGADLSSFIHYPSPLAIPHLYPHTLTSTLTPALTLPSHFQHRKVYCQGFCLQNLTKVPEKYSYLVPTVQHRYTNSIAMPDYQYSYAALSVQGCCAFGARMLHFYRHYYSKAFTTFFFLLTGNIKGELKAHSSFYYSKTYP